MEHDDVILLIVRVLLCVALMFLLIGLTAYVTYLACLRHYEVLPIISIVMSTIAGKYTGDLHIYTRV